MAQVKVKSKRERQVACGPPRSSLRVYRRNVPCMWHQSSIRSKYDLNRGVMVIARKMVSWVSSSQ